MKTFSAINREAILQEMKESTFDLIIIGGGITGAGIALDATIRGLKVALVEMQDFAAGTSSRSTKLIHGGLRYLKQMEFKLVAEVGKERAIVYQNAPHLTKPEHLLLPIIKGGSLNTFTGKLGMTIYEWLAGVKKKEKHQILNKAETLAAEPLLKEEILKGGILFYEYRTDDARITIEVIKEAVERGALAMNYLKADSFIYEGDSIAGVKVKNQLNGDPISIKAKYIVNAGGPWVDAIDDIDQPQAQHKLIITKGIHIVVDGKKLPLKHAAYFDTHDERMVFVIPREGKVYIGTTDTFYKENLENPKATTEDIQYLLKCVHELFPSVKLSAMDVESGWVGLRPLIQKKSKGPSAISRKDELFISKSGLITIAGGKLTGYRKMAEQVLDLIAKKIKNSEGKNIPASSTATIPLSGGKVGGAAKFPEFMLRKKISLKQIGLNDAEAEMLINRFGSNVDKLLTIFDRIKDEKNMLPLILRVQIHYCVEEEMCIAPSDFLVRRTGILYFDIKTLHQFGEEVVLYMQSILAWDDSLKNNFRDDLNDSRF